MKLKTAAILSVIACIFCAAHYNDQVTVSVTLPSPAQVVNAAGKMANELKESSCNNGLGIEINNSGQNSTSNSDVGYYRIRTSWEDFARQIGAYSELESAINNCPLGYYVFNEVGEIVYNPNTE